LIIFIIVRILVSIRCGLFKLLKMNHVTMLLIPQIISTRTSCIQRIIVLLIAPLSCIDFNIMSLLTIDDNMYNLLQSITYLVNVCPTTNYKGLKFYSKCLKLNVVPISISLICWVWAWQMSCIMFCWKLPKLYIFIYHLYDN
jgi:hypothetical protein